MRIAFSPVKLAVCFGSIALALVIATTIIACADDEDLGRYALDGGRQRFVVQRYRNALISPVFGAVILVPGLALYVFRKALRREYERAHPVEISRWEAASPSAKIVGYCVGYGFVGIIAAMFAVLWVFAVIVWPYNGIRAITIAGDRVELGSLYTNWSVAKANVASVEVQRVDRRQVRRRGSGIAYSVTITTRDGRTFKSGEMLTCPEPGTPEDQRLDRLFKDLVGELRP